MSTIPTNSTKFVPFSISCNTFWLSNFPFHMLFFVIVVGTYVTGSLPMKNITYIIYLTFSNFQPVAEFSTESFRYKYCSAMGRMYKLLLWKSFIAKSIFERLKNMHRMLTVTKIIVFIEFSDSNTCHRLQFVYLVKIFTYVCCMLWAHENVNLIWH